jgi:D-arabinose 1-dehydrogenase-like Zn-dependent alcohol dehydrogenase
METVLSPMPKQQTKAASAALKACVGGHTMNAINLDRKAGTEALVAGDIPRPKLQAGEVLVKVHATAVMPFVEPRPFPIVLSHEFSGVVEPVGAKVNGFNVGDEVYPPIRSVRSSHTKCLWNPLPLPG